MENEQEATVETVEVNIGAVAMVCRVIAACTERGAIKAEEMSTVGQVFDYMRAFLPAPEATAEATAEGEEGAEVSAEEETAEAESDILEPAKG
jgi:hypothetical protein